MQEKQKELNDSTASQASAILPREWKKIKTNNKGSKRYSDLHKAEKQRYEDIQQFQEDNLDDVKITSLHKKCTKAGAKEDAKDGVKAGVKTPRN